VLPEVLHPFFGAFLQLIDDLAGVVGHVVRAGRVGVSSDELLVDSHQLQNVVKVVLHVLLLDVVVHYEVKEVIYDCFDELRLLELGVVPLRQE
jgi:hypothetical protein